MLVKPARNLMVTREPTRTPGLEVMLVWGRGIVLRLTCCGATASGALHEQALAKLEARLEHGLRIVQAERGRLKREREAIARGEVPR